MDKNISFTVPGLPIAKGRARSFVSNGKIGHYTPEKTRNYEALVKLVSSQAMNGKKILDCAVAISLEIHMPIPESWSAKKRNEALEDRLHPTVKPDSSNILKAIEDAINGIVYIDDKQIVRHFITKVYSTNPRAEVIIFEV